MKISLIDLEADVEFNYEPADVVSTPADTEYLPAIISIYSVKVNGIELISLIPKEDLVTMEAQILEEDGLNW